jgi:TRAP-type C4-dicarboxylate transport system permease small subunit
MSEAANSEGGGAQVLRLVDAALCWIGGALVVLLLVDVTAGIVTRAMNDPLAWTDEAAGFLMVWLASFGWMIATRRHAHICINFFANMLSGRSRGLLDVLLTGSTVLFGAAVVVTSLYQIQTNSDVEAIALPIVMAWLYVPLVPAGAMTFVQALADFIDAARRMVVPAGEETP